jgi:Sugar efflux transporter for intercellular exchange
MQYEHFRSQEMEKSIAAALEQERKKIADPSVEEQDQQTLPVATYAGTPEQPTKSQSFEDTARIVQEVEAKNMVAPARQDTFLMANILLWLAIISLVSYASAFSQTTLELIVGVTVNLNIIVFYGAPLSTIATVLKTRNAVTIHIPTLILNSLNATFWACYGIAIMDPIVIVPNSCGLSLGVVQFVLCVLFPRTELAPAKDDSAKSSTVGDEEAQSDDAAAAAASS